MHTDQRVLRELAQRTLEVAGQPVQDQRRRLWADLNSKRSHQVPVYILDPQGMWDEVCPPLTCRDPFFRKVENWMRLQLYHASFGDDFVTEGFITLPPVMNRKDPNWQTWGIPTDHQRVQGSKAYHFAEYTERTLEDIETLHLPRAEIDEVATGARLSRVQDAVGDLLPVYLDRYPQFNYSLSNLIALFFGPENMLYQFYDAPELMHAFAQKLSSGIDELFVEAEQQGWFAGINRTYGGNAEIQAMAYNHEIANPNEIGAVPRKQRWIYDCAQEFESVSPQMFEEFLLRYMRPVYERFGLLAYGCCENLTEKLEPLMQVKNLRRVAVTPWADPEKCAEILGDRYVISWRPNPSEMVTNGFDEQRITRIVENAKRIFEKHNCYWEVNLKDFLSVEGEEKRLEKWVRVVRQALQD